jgi:DNA-binding NarL/FixJ family response regulator
VTTSLSIPDSATPHPARVLLADDHQAILALAASALQGDYQVVGSVLNGTALLAAAAQLDPDAIVLDITMPHLDGLEAARTLRRIHSRARLVFLTVHEDPDFAQAAFDAGGLGYVVKPRLASDLLSAVRAALAGRRFLSPTVHLGEAA